MIDQAGLDLAVVDCGDDDRVSRVGGRLVGLHRFEPVEGGIFTVEQDLGGDKGQKRSVGGSNGYLSLPLRLDEAVLGGRQIVGVDLGRVVHHRTSPSRDAGPQAVGVAELGGDDGDRFGVERHKEVGEGNGAKRGRFLGEEHVGGGVVALGKDLGGELGAVAVSHLDGTAG